MIPMGQVVSKFKVDFEESNIWRWNRARMVRIHADPSVGLPSALLARVKPQIEQAYESANSWLEIEKPSSD